MKALLLLLVITTSYASVGKVKTTGKTTDKTKSTFTGDSWYRLENVIFGIGSYTEFTGELQTDDKGNTNDFILTPYLSIAAEAITKWDFYFYPEIILVLPDDGDSGKITTTTYMFRADMAHKLFNDQLTLSVGTSLVMTTISGSGGTITLRNGDNQSDAFFAPDETRTSFNNTIDFGASYFIEALNLNLKTQAFVFSVFNSQRSMISYTLSLNYFWDGAKTMDFF
jgi:hypothetical protein